MRCSILFKKYLQIKLANWVCWDPRRQLKSKIILKNPLGILVGKIVRSRCRRSRALASLDFVWQVLTMFSVVGVLRSFPNDSFKCCPIEFSMLRESPPQVFWVNSAKISPGDSSQVFPLGTLKMSSSRSRKYLHYFRQKPFDFNLRDLRFVKWFE